MQLQIGGVEHALHAQRRRRRVEAARQRIDRRAQAQLEAHHQQLRQGRAEVAQIQIGQAVAVQLLAGLGHRGRQRQAQLRQHVVAVAAVGGMRRAAVHQNAQAVVGQQAGGQQVPGVVFLLARVAGPVHVDGGQGGEMLPAHRPAGVQEAGQLFGGLLLDAQQHQEGADLGRFRLAAQDHRHGVGGFFPGEAAPRPFATAQGAHIGRERMFAHELSVSYQPVTGPCSAIRATSRS